MSSKVKGSTGAQGEREFMSVKAKGATGFQHLPFTKSSREFRMDGTRVGGVQRRGDNKQLPGFKVS